MVTTYYIVPSCMCSGVFMKVKFTTMVLCNAVGKIFTSFVLVWVIIKLARGGMIICLQLGNLVPFSKQLLSGTAFRAITSTFSLLMVTNCWAMFARLRPSSWMNHFGSI